MSALLDDLRAETRARLDNARPPTASAVRSLPHAVVALSEPMQKELKALKVFLFTHMYQHPRVIASMTRAKAVITDLFEAFCADPKLLPQDWSRQSGEAGIGGVVRDYIAGMTDTYALAEYTRVYRTNIEL